MKIFEIIKRIIKKTLRKISKLHINTRQAYYNIFGSKVECNICHYKATKLNNDCWHLYCNCPNCSSGVHERLLMASLTYLDKFSFDTIISNKKVLHFAPEKSLRKIIQRIAKDYKTADFLAEGYSYDNIDFQLDISDMKTIKNETFDCVIACDVLEHVPNHIGGMKEVYRILKKGGYCIFTVPQKDKLKKTIEDLSITDGNEREKMFGQHDHLRIYGDDFISMLEDSGFEVTAVNESFFDNNMVDHFVLSPPILSKHPLATNYRKVFFGKKI